MDKDELTPQEIEALGGARPVSDESAAAQPDEVADRGRVVAGQLAERFGAVLSGLLRLPVEVRTGSVSQRTVGQFAAGLNSTGCCCVIAVPGESAELVLDVGPTILYPMIARLLGGDPRRPVPLRRGLTEIERRLAGRIVAALVDELRAHWAGRLDLSGGVARLENELAAADADQNVSLLTLEVSLGEPKGLIRLAVPGELWERVSEPPDETAAGDGEATLSPESAEQVGRALDNSLVELRVELARTRVSAAELLDLGVGDVITTDQPADAPLMIRVGDGAEYEVRPGTHDGQKAVQIERRVEGK